MPSASRKTILVAVLAALGGCGGAAARGGAIPAQFHGIWADRQECAHPNGVRMAIRADGYSREEIDAEVRDVEILGESPLRVRIRFDSRAEGYSWSGSEEWTMSFSQDAFTYRTEAVGEIEAFETRYVRCGGAGGRSPSS